MNKNNLEIFAKAGFTIAEATQAFQRFAQAAKASNEQFGDFCKQLEAERWRTDPLDLIRFFR